jgi:hypothetical protein
MTVMPRPRPPHLHREITCHGRAVWFFRLGKGRRIRIRGEYGSDEFNAAYDAALAGRPVGRCGRRQIPEQDRRLARRAIP